MSTDKQLFLNAVHKLVKPKIAGKKTGEPLLTATLGECLRAAQRSNIIIRGPLINGQQRMKAVTISREERRKKEGKSIR